MVRKRVLVVEDEYILAAAIASQLEIAGFAVVGPATSVADALALIEMPGCDAAIVDVNLGRDTCEPLGRELAARGVPFVVSSAAESVNVPPQCARARHVPKPARASVLIAALREALTEAMPS